MSGERGRDGEREGERGKKEAERRRESERERGRERGRERERESYLPLTSSPQSMGASADGGLDFAGTEAAPPIARAGATLKSESGQGNVIWWAHPTVRLSYDRTRT